MNDTELVKFLLMLIGFGAGMVYGCAIGWMQRDKDKKRDTQSLAEYILRSCEKEVKPKLMRIK